MIKLKKEDYSILIKSLTESIDKINLALIYEATSDYKRKQLLIDHDKTCCILKQFLEHSNQKIITIGIINDHDTYR